jgi:ribonuclease P protein component
LAKFPKAARLLKKSDFRFRPYQKFFSDLFSFYFSKNGRGRLGISVSKKVLKSAVDRNRLKRLLREVYRERREAFPKVDIHVVAREGELDRWKGLKKKDIEKEWEGWASELQKERKSRTDGV